MSVAAIALILIAAFLHAGWNILTKKVRGDAAFTWLFNTIAVVVYAPVALVWIALVPLQWSASLLLGIVLSSLFHTIYFIFLQRGYRVADMSVVYPLARGTGPLLAALAGVVLLGERPGLWGVIGIGLIVCGVFSVSGGLRGLRAASGLKRGVQYGLLTGVCIASYTLVDKVMVSSLLIAPLVYDWIVGILRSLLLTPYAAHHWDTVRYFWNEHRAISIWVGIMNTLAYILILTALQFTPVSYVAPAREISILVGVVLSARLFAEGHAKARTLSALIIVVGIVALFLD